MESGLLFIVGREMISGLANDTYDTSFPASVGCNISFCDATHGKSIVHSNLEISMLAYKSSVRRQSFIKGASSLAKLTDSVTNYGNPRHLPRKNCPKAPIKPLNMVSVPPNPVMS